MKAGTFAHPDPLYGYPRGALLNGPQAQIRIACMQRFPRPRTLRRSTPLLAAVLLSLLTLLGLAVAGGARPASAALVTTTFANAQTKLCLGNTAGAVVAGQCNGQPSQQWTVTPVGDPNVTITNVQTGLCLDSAGQNPAVSPVGAVFTDPCSSTSRSQVWFALPDPAADGNLVFMNANTGMVLDSNQAGATYVNSANGGTFQNWALPAFPALPGFIGGASAVQTTLTDAQTGLCLDDNAGAVKTDQCGGQPSQQWSMAAAGATVVITNQQTGQCLDGNFLNPALPSDGAVFTSPCNGSSLSQQWFLAIGTGGNVLMNERTGRILDSNAAGAVYGQTANGGNFQNWHTTQLPVFPVFGIPPVA